MGVVRLMKYKVGDKVKIKRNTTLLGYPEVVKSYLNKNNYILTIYDVNVEKECYEMDGWQGPWSEGLIECLYIEPIYEPVKSRFELLDL